MSHRAAEKEVYDSIVQPGVQLFLLPGPLGGKLLLEERVSSGPQCDFYKGVWAPSEYDYKPVAAKYIRSPLLADNVGYGGDQAKPVFTQITWETSIWTSLRHPNIVPFHGYQTGDEKIILISTWSDNRSIDSFLALYPELTIIDKLELLQEAACGLVYLHSLIPPIAHGGIQPKNVIITNKINAALSDTGLSRVMAGLGIRTGVTTGGGDAEFSAYLAAEIILGDSLPTAKSDVYSFASLILLTLSGKQPYWKMRTRALVLIAVASGKTPRREDHPVLDCRAEIWETLEACWNRDPDRRPAMTEVKEALEAYIFECDESWSSDGPKRARVMIPTREEHTVGDGGELSSTHRPPARNDFLASAPLEESPFISGAPVRDLIPQLKLEGSLTKIERMGSGGYGDVFQGVWKKPNGKVLLVAIKSIRGSVTTKKGGEANQDQSDFLTRIIRETTIWKVAQHPNILPFHGYQVVGGEAMLVSPWCENGSLDAYIEKNNRLSDAKKLELLCDAARGLTYLHTRTPPIAHGDIKPQNVIITDKIEGALCDFGIARVMCDFTTGVTSRNPGAGTTRYQAKEQLLDAAQPTNMSDIYAFGGLILATMSGKPPFYSHKTTTSIIFAITQGKTPAQADHPELKAEDPLWNLLRECWKPEPTERPSIKQVSRTLDAETRRRSMMQAD